MAFNFKCHIFVSSVKNMKANTKIHKNKPILTAGNHLRQIEMFWVKNIVTLVKLMTWEQKYFVRSVSLYSELCCPFYCELPKLYLRFEMAGTGRQFFDESEKICLQELILKYKLNSMATTMGNAATKKTAWTRLTQEFNTIETNSKRTEAQLKKCWDNMKTRRKSILAQEKRERMRTGGGAFNPESPSTSSPAPVLEDALADQTDVELIDVIDSDNIPCSEVLQIDHLILPDTPPEVSAATIETRTQSLNESLAGRDDILDTTPRLSDSRLTSYSVAPSQASRNIRTKVIEEEFRIRQKTYERSQKREEELHKLKVAEKEWMIRAAEENFLKVRAEREAAEELVRCNRAKREEAELSLLCLKNKNLQN